MSYLELDFKSRDAKNIRPKKRDNPAPPDKKNLRRIARLSSMVITAVAATYLILFSFTDSAAKVEDSNLKPSRLHYPVSLPSDPIEEISPGTTETATPGPVTKPENWKTLKIKSGDTLASLFESVGLGASVTYEVDALNEQTQQLRKIRPGQTISVLTSDDNKLISLEYHPDITRTLVVTRTEGGNLSSKFVDHPLDPIPTYKSGIIKTSLFEAAADNDISENIIMELAGIFGWDIDFALDIREGDEFGIVYNELYKDGEKIKDGQILAAQFVNQGTIYKAVYYTDPKGETGYFSPDGKSMRKAFLRAPVDFRRISSRFTRQRWHPVLGKKRPHRGVDYAAKIGTPIKAAGDGKIIHRGTKGGYGKTVIIQHGQRYTTLYGHMNNYAKGAPKGKRVKQGQIIGYVGKTGLATGPHLHYEFRVNGVHRNPLTVKLPAAEPVNKAYRSHFEKQTRSHLAMLDLMGQRKVADSSQ